MTDQQQAGAAGAVDETEPAATEAGALWKEFDDAEKPAPAPDGAGADEGLANDDGGAPATEGEPGDEPGEPDPAEGDKPAGNDIWASVPPEVRAAYEAAKARADEGEHYKRSNEGRIAALQKKIERLEKRPNPPAQDAAGGKDEASPSIFDDDEFKAFRDEYPEVAKPIEKAMKRQAELIDRLTKSLTERSGAEAEAAEEANYEAVKAAHDDYDAVIQSPEFREWFNRAPSFVKDGVKRNGQSIVDPTEVIELTALFKQQTGFGQKKPTPTDPKADARRRSQLNGSRSPGSRGPGAVTGVPDDPQGAWDAWERMGH